MSKKLWLSSVLGLAVAMTPLASIAGMGAEENINIYGWQNWSYEFVDADRTFENNSYFVPAADDDREFDRIQGNAANIGFMAHMDTGIDGLQVGLRCEQFTFHNRLTSSGWCNRNSKISLRHETAGEIMFGQWLLPYNEIVAQWVDPFYDAGADSHTSIMGNIGFGGTFYNGGTFPLGTGADFSYEGLYALSFNRRQEEIIQYVWPNTSAMASQARDGFQFRAAMTTGNKDDAHLDTFDAFSNTRASDTGDPFAGGTTGDARGNSPADVYPDTEFGSQTADGFTDTPYDLDPRIYSVGASYQHNLANGDQFWLAVAYQRHDDITALEIARPTNFPAEQYGAGVLCDDSEDDAFRIASRYKHDWGNGQSTWIAAMYEELEYDADNCLYNDGSAANPLWADVDRDSWMISGKHAFGNGFDVRFSYMDADELDCPGGVCGEPGFYSEYQNFGRETGHATVRTDGSTALRPDGTPAANIGEAREANNFSDNDTDAQAYNFGLFYTMPAGTELRLTYSHVDNEDSAGYDFGIGGTNLWNVTDDNTDEDVSMVAVGIVHWFD